MVYCGKPSKGCQECRDRKTRCDRATPSCSQCIRGKRQCPGYRDQLDLMFRNENEHVAGKAKAKERLKQKSKSPSPKAASRHSEEPSSPQFQDNSVSVVSQIRNGDSHGQFTQAFLPTFTMFPTIEECSLSTFSTNAPSWFLSGDALDCVSGQTHSDEHLIASMAAVGLASFSATIHAPELMVRARKDYVTALQLTNAALRSPKEVKKDSTLFAVMILGIFETVSGSTAQSLEAWTEHINGAATLVKLRGPEQFNTNAGKAMFAQVVGYLMLSCIQRSTPMPDHILELRKAYEYCTDIENSTWEMSGIIIDFTIFRSAVRECKVIGPRAIINAALEIDRRFMAVVENLPSHWKYETVYTDENPELIWNSMYHVYKDHMMIRMWNAMRTCRILLHEMVRDQLLSASTAITPIFTEAEAAARLKDSINIMIQTRTDILASIPQHTPSILSNSPSSLLEGSRVYFVMWPLYLVGAMDLTTNAIREWAIARLRNIGETVGLRQALVLADFMATRTHPKSWDTKPAPELEKAKMDVERAGLPELVEV